MLPPQIILVSDGKPTDDWRGALQALFEVPWGKRSIRQAIAIDPQYTQAFVNLGLTLAAERNYSEAEQYFHSALKMDSNNAGALTALGMLQGKTGRDTDSAAG